MHPCILHHRTYLVQLKLLFYSFPNLFINNISHISIYFTHLYLKQNQKHDRAMRLPNDILYTISQFISLPDYLSLTSSIFTPLLSISRKKRIEWCRSKIRLYPFQNNWCSVSDCYNRKLVCFELEPRLHTNVLSNYCGKHTVEYFHLSDLTILLTK
jgi:hypothetical protein